ncbi:MAG TPA: acyl-CoA dehydrogenase family protein, partial [Candidatus Dormibacteraeota bacterium]|nr:acyl-CoA dehydrogenase family protein [Candidatus Dormibacteraeota bacterium]
MDFALTDLQQALHEEVLTLAGRFSLDYWREHDREERYPWEFVRAFAERGWLGAIIPPEYGGSGLGMTEAALILHAICLSGAGTSGASPVHFFIFPPAPVVHFGSEA